MASPPAPAPLSSIDGMLPGRVMAPSDGRDVAEALAVAASDGLAVAPVGGATALGLGNLPERLDQTLLMTDLAGVIEYEPTDLVISVRAGTRFGDLQAILADHGQTLPIEAPRLAASTIGGLVATALAGPRRLGSGTLRDLLIGISVAHPSGAVTKAGGMVVKNVTGFDLPRLYHGSLGTLGVILSANFKVLPLPRSEATVVARFSSLEVALDSASHLYRSALRPVALEVGQRESGWFAAARLEGREQTVRVAADEAERLFGADAERFTEQESASWWEAYLAPQAVDMWSNQSDVLARCAVRPRDVARLAQDVVRTADEREYAISYLACSVGVGTVVVRGSFLDGGSGDALRGLQDWLLRIADHVTILSAPANWKRGLDIWGRAPETLDVMRALKEQFDPQRVLNPGRFAGGIYTPMDHPLHSRGMSPIPI